MWYLSHKHSKYGGPVAEPGIVPIGVSAPALQRSRRSRRKGYAADFNVWHERWKEGEVVGTPALPQLLALAVQLARIEAETLATRYKRHRRMSQLVHGWAKSRSWKHVAPADYLLPSVSCLRPPIGLQAPQIVAALRDRGYLVDDGYGKLKGQILRIGHMGDWQEADLEELLAALDQAAEGVS